MSEVDSVLFCSLSSGSALNDGQWHSVDFSSRRGRLTIAVDKEDGGVAHAGLPFPVTAGHRLFFGGEKAKISGDV